MPFIEADVSRGVARGGDHLQEVWSRLDTLAAPEDHHLVRPAGLFHDLHEGHAAETDEGQGVDVAVDLGVAPVEELAHAPHVVEMAMGDEDLFQEGDIEDLAQLVEHAVEVAGVDEGAAFVEHIDVAAHTRFFDPPDAFQSWVVFAQMNHGSS